MVSLIALLVVAVRGVAHDDEGAAAHGPSDPRRGPGSGQGSTGAEDLVRFPCGASRSHAVGGGDSLACGG